MATKHDQMIQHLESLPVGERVSVRGLAKAMNMSEGTAYRAIKDAENLGIVSTIERVGTIRIEKKTKRLPEMLKFSEIVSIIEGKIIGGASGLNRPLSKFIIGAMTPDQIEKYYEPHTLMIVGNRAEVQRQSLYHDVAVLITGGFEAEEDIVKLAEEKSLPLISTPFDTFTVATIINRSMADQAIKKDILTIEDVYVPINKTESLVSQDTVKTFHEISNRSGLSRFPVHYNKRLIGIITAKDLIGRSEQTPIERIMTKEVITAKKYMTVAAVSQIMIREDIEMLPVVADNLNLLGVISRQDVMKAMQTIQKQPQIGNTFEDDIIVHLEESYHIGQDGQYDYQLVVQPQMLNSMGTIANGVLCELIGNVATSKFFNKTGLNIFIEKIDLHYFKLIQMYNMIQFRVEVVHQNRQSTLIEVDIFYENINVAKAIITAQIIETT